MRTALITGASSGIGRKVALHLAKCGFQVTACARRENLLSALAEELGPQHMVRALDVTKRGAVRTVVSEIIDKHGGLDLLFNNAGINVQGTCGIEGEAFDSVIGTNLTGAWNVLNEVVPHMKLREQGTIINVSSICGKTAFPDVGIYSASKFGLLAINESLFRELVPLGIRVTALCPSWVNTDMAVHGPMSDDKKIQTNDICTSIDYLLSLSPNAHVKELVLECGSDLI
ncbi:MAG: SDR family oxidoreductase [Bdellovibrionales bacterium]|nr:SDR family oxidoreductase [Bdellovibrionales bacterium]